MKSMSLVMAFALLILSGTAYAVNRDEGMQPAEGMFLPEGDAKAGREAYLLLKCNACHAVYNDNLPAPVSEKTGPVLGLAQMDYALGWLASAIVTPSHTLSTGEAGLSEGGQQSRMGDFSETMTVRQLIDILAYLKSAAPSMSDPTPSVAVSPA